MRLALFADLHANRQALEACLAHAAAQGADRHAFLGDLVGYGGDPAWVVDTVMAHVARGALAVQGNHDQAMVQPPDGELPYEMAAMLDWTRGQLSPSQQAFLAGLPLTQALGSLLCVHASAAAPARWEYVNGVEPAGRSLRATDSRIVFSGHVHVPALYRLAADGRVGHHAPQPGVALRLAPQHRHLVLPGALGQPRDANNAACYALYDDAAHTLCYFRVPYDHGAAARQVIARGLPMVYAMRLVEGI